jgi:nucleotide-binding universal stress UspA family protein
LRYMSSILTALNTGTGGDSAIHYACGLAASLKLPVRIVNPFTVPITLGEMPMPMLPVEEVRASAERQLDDCIIKLKEGFPSVEVKATVAYGALADILDEEVGNNNPVITVIGHDLGEDPDIWIGSDSTDILREGKGSVLVVSNNAVYADPGHVCLACDTQSIKEGLPLNGLLVLQKLLGFRITVLHVVTSGEESIPFSSSPLYQQLDKASSVSFAEVSATGEIDEVIASFPDTHDVDWLALAPHHYGFWQGMFHKSHTSRVLHLAHVPILGLHE